MFAFCWYPMLSKIFQLLTHFIFVGVSFNTADKDLKHQIPVAIDVFARGVEAFVNDPKQVH